MKLQAILLPVVALAVLQLGGCSNSSPQTQFGGPYRSESAGAHFDQSATWTDPTNTELPTSAALSFQRAYRPLFAPDTIYIAVGADGLVKSIDGGATWSLIKVPLAALDVVALENGVIIVSSTDAAGQGYVIRSADEGKSWQTVLTVPVPIAKKSAGFFSPRDAVPSVVISISPDPFVADRVYAGTSLGTILAGEQSAKTWRTLYNLSGGVFTSTARPNTSLSIKDIVSSIHRQDELAVITNQGELWITNSEAQTKVIVAPATANQSRFSSAKKKQVLTVAYIPEFPDALFAGVDDGAVISRDSGETWEQLKLPVDTVQKFNSSVVAVSPTNSARLLVGINSVVYRSEDGGVSWNTFSLGLKSHIITEILIDPSNAANVLLVLAQLAV